MDLSILLWSRSIVVLDYAQCDLRCSGKIFIKAVVIEQVLDQYEKCKAEKAKKKHIIFDGDDD